MTCIRKLLQLSSTTLTSPQILQDTIVSFLKNSDSAGQRASIYANVYEQSLDWWAGFEEEEHAL